MGMSAFTTVWTVAVCCILFCLSGADGDHDGCDVRGTCRSLDNSDQDGAVEEFREWLVSMGKDMCPTVLKETRDEGWGLFALGTIQEGDVICQMPMEAILTSTKARMSELKEVIAGHGMGNQSALALFLLLQKRKGRESHWASYINMLPGSEATPPTLSPLYWNVTNTIASSASSLNAGSHPLDYPLLSETMFSTVEDLRHALDTAHASLVRSFSQQLERIFGDDTYLSKGWWYWAMGIVWSRSFQVTLSNASADVALIPGIDTMNHRELEKTSQEQRFRSSPIEIDETQDTVKARASRAFQHEEQVFINYGRKTSAEFFIMYGFVPTSNDSDGVSVPLYVSSEDEMAEMRREILRRMGLNQNLQSNCKFTKQGPTDILLFILRVLMLGYSDLTDILSDITDGVSVNLKQLYSPQNESSAMLYLHLYISLQLQEHASILEFAGDPSIVQRDRHQLVRDLIQNEDEVLRHSRQWLHLRCCHLRLQGEVESAFRQSISRTTAANKSSSLDMMVSKWMKSFPPETFQTFGC